MALVKVRKHRVGNSLVMVVGLVCVTAIAEGVRRPLNPVDLMPQTFSRLNYIARQPVAVQAADDSNSKLIPAQLKLGQLEGFRALKSNPSEFELPQSTFTGVANSAADDKDHAKSQHQINEANADLDLAIENFFYALEDLVQSAARHSDVAGVELDEQGTYVIQVQFPADVMYAANTRLGDSDTSGALAQNQPVTVPRDNTHTLPGSAKTEGSDPSLYAFLKDFKYKGSGSIAVEHNDNLLVSTTNKISEQVTVANLSGSMESRNRKSSLRFEGGVNAGYHRTSREDDYFDYSTKASYSTLLGDRSKAFIGVGHFKHHENRGQTDNLNGMSSVLSAPIEFESTVVRGVFEQGTRRTRLRFTADATLDRLRAENFRDLDGINSRDRDVQTLVGTAFLNWSQRMSLLLEVRHQEAKYPNDFNGRSLDSSQSRLAVGAEWLATRKTAGSVRIGYQGKGFDDGQNEDASAVSWQTIIEWTPRPRTEFVFESQRDFLESDGFGSTRDSTAYKVSWNQKWTPRVQFYDKRSVW